MITAGLAVALQNVILAVVAYFFLIGRYGVRVGDRITLAGVTGRVVEIVHTRVFFIPTEFYFVRVISEAGRSRLELYVAQEWVGKLEDTVARCA